MVTGNWPAQADALRPSIFLEKSSAKTEWAFGDKSNCFDSDTELIAYCKNTKKTKLEHHDQRKKKTFMIIKNQIIQHLAS